jgi:predicted transcriptional regulator
MGYLDVEGHVNLVRDEQSGAILNTDNSQYNQYMALRSSKVQKDKKIDAIESDLARLKDDINEIKSLLGKLVNG